MSTRVKDQEIRIGANAPGAFTPLLLLLGGGAAVIGVYLLLRGTPKTVVADAT